MQGYQLKYLSLAFLMLVDICYEQQGTGLFDSVMCFGASTAVQQHPLLIISDMITSTGACHVSRHLVYGGGSVLMPEKCFHLISDVTDPLMSVSTSQVSALAHSIGF